MTAAELTCCDCLCANNALPQLIVLDPVITLIPFGSPRFHPYELTAGDCALRFTQLLEFCICLTVIFVNPAAADVVVHVDTPMAPPYWALLERQLIEAHTPACQEFYDRYFDSRGYLLCVERWGGDDGPDDAPENLNGWPILHAIGGDDSIIDMCNSMWEGHLRQYTEAKTVDVPFARDGMYYKEFPVMMDWLHNGEGLAVFNVMPLSDPYNAQNQKRIRRYAGFYMNEDPQAPNYDPAHRIIRSMFNGSRGPLLRKATGLDWAGDPIEVKNRFKPLHGEENYEQMVAHFKDYNDTIGDHPQNMAATSLAVNAYMLTGDEKYKTWILEYVDAWVARCIENGGIIPSNIGLDGVIGSAAGGKWYGGVYGWGFRVEVPQTPGIYTNRNTVAIGLQGFVNAYMLTADEKYLDAWRGTLDGINANGKRIDGKMMYPSAYGENGWYNFSPSRYSSGASTVYYMSMNRDDLRRMDTSSGWYGYLEGNDPGFPERQLQSDIGEIRARVEASRNDTTTPDTRLSDDPMGYNPARIGTLVNLMLGGPSPGGIGRVLKARLRYFDPEQRRAGVPDDVAALVESLTDTETVVTFVNVNPTESRTFVVQTGGYAEHECIDVAYNGKMVAVGDTHFTVRLEPGAGGQLTIRNQRFANPPNSAFPWDR
jgi:hypothetical protein